MRDEFKYVTLERDPFARASLLRRIDTHGPCEWCGRENSKFYYAWCSDGTYDLNFLYWQGPFCNKECYETYQRLY